MPYFVMRFRRPNVAKLARKGDVPRLLALAADPAHRPAVFEALKAAGDIAIPSLVSYLDADLSEWGTRELAREAFVAIGSSAVPALLARVRDQASDYGARSNAVEALGLVADPSVVQALVDVRDEAFGVAQALSRCADVPTLTALLADPDESVRELAVDALSWRHEPAATDALLTFLERDEGSESLVGEVLWELIGRMKPDSPEHKLGLRKSVTGLRAIVRASAPARLKPQEAKSVLRVRELAAKWLSSVEGVDAADAWIAIIEDQPSVIAADRLASLGESRAVEPLLRALSRMTPVTKTWEWSPDNDIHAALVKTLVALGAPPAAPTLEAGLRTLVSMLESNDWGVRGDAAAALAAPGVAEALGEWAIEPVNKAVRRGAWRTGSNMRWNDQANDHIYTGSNIRWNDELDADYIDEQVEGIERNLKDVAARLRRPST